MLYNPRLTRDEVRFFPFFSFCWSIFLLIYSFGCVIFCRKHSRTSWQVSNFSLVFRNQRECNEYFTIKESLKLLLIGLDWFFFIFLWPTDLNLAYPKMIDIAVPANIVCGMHDPTPSLPSEPWSVWMFDLPVNQNLMGILCGSFSLWKSSGWVWK